MTLRHSYYLTRRGDRLIPTHSIKPSLDIPLTSHSRIRYSMYYNIEDKKLIAHDFAFTRDLHCWEAHLSWIPSGVQEGYFFRMNIKAIPDLKIERKRGSARIGMR